MIANLDNVMNKVGEVAEVAGEVASVTVIALSGAATLAAAYVASLAVMAGYGYPEGLMLGGEAGALAGMTVLMCKTPEINPYLSNSYCKRATDKVRGYVNNVYERAVSKVRER